MTPLTKYQRLMMKLEEMFCKHEWFTIQVPKGWTFMRGSLVCRKCTKSIGVEVEIKR